MKFVRWGPKGEEKPGILLNDGSIADISGEIDDVGGHELSGGTLKRLAAMRIETFPRIAATQRLGPCVGRVGHFLGVGLNYGRHANEVDMPVPDEPVIFSKAPSCISGACDDVYIPSEASKLDYEVELAVVIGEQAFRIDQASALNYVAGYCVCNDVSERQFQLERGGQWLKGKSYPTFGPLGPWLVTPDEIVDPQKLGMWLDVDGERRQQATTREMIFSVSNLISYISHFMILEPGDVITTGTPPGVAHGMGRPRYLSAGNVVTLGIEGLGSQEQTVVLTDEILS